jgi:hypothetical protein
MRYTFSSLAFIAMILTIVGPGGALAAAEVGQPAPALVVEELNGQTFDLSAQRGKVVVINFWVRGGDQSHAYNVVSAV